MRSKYDYQFKKSEDVSETNKVFPMNEKIELAGTLAAGLAHEIKNPLTTIKGFVQLLAIGEAKPEYFSTIFEEINQIEDIINKLWSFGEPYAGMFSNSDVMSILEKSIWELSDQAQTKSVDIYFQSEAESYNMNCDRENLQQVFYNVIKNAIEASADYKSIFINCRKHDSYIHVTVQDQGVGIPRDRLERVFEPFYCIKENGTGFGLMESYKIIKEHNGIIHIGSEVESGTTVDIYLPVD